MVHNASFNGSSTPTHLIGTAHNASRYVGSGDEGEIFTSVEERRVDVGIVVCGRAMVALHCKVKALFLFSILAVALLCNLVVLKQYSVVVPRL